MGDMYFGTWIDSDVQFFDTAHFTDSLAKYPFQGGGCYLLLGSVEVGSHFATITIRKCPRCLLSQTLATPTPMTGSLLFMNSSRNALA